MVKTLVAVAQLLAARVSSATVRLLELVGVVLIVAGVYRLGGLGAALIAAGVAALAWSLDVEVNRSPGETG